MIVIVILILLLLPIIIIMIMMIIIIIRMICAPPHQRVWMKRSNALCSQVFVGNIHETFTCPQISTSKNL